MNIFEFNHDPPVIEEFMGSKIYYIDNFFKDPDNVVKFLEKSPVLFHKPRIKEGFENLNGINFYDMRHEMNLSDFSPVVKYLSEMCGQKVAFDKDLLQTNMIRFKNMPFNDYKNNYWHPHTDLGYTGLIYLNKGDEQNGTNFYEPTDSFYNPNDNEGEHATPWKSKDEWLLLKTIKPRYNRCILFNGLIYHGMNIENERYFVNEFRKNISVFFKADKIYIE